MVLLPWLAVALVTVACSPYGGGAFACTDHAQCTGAAGGQCEPDGRCSFEDTACASGRRYGELSGDRASICVGEVPGDGAVDVPAPDDARVPDGGTPAPFCDPTTPGLVGCWEFEDNTNDAAGDANHAVATNTSFITGRVGQGLQMAANSTVSVADSTSMSPPTLTIEAWINPSMLPSGNSRMGVIDNQGSYGFFISATGLACTVTVAVNATVTIPMGAWSHVACTYDGVTGRVYFNGTQVSAVLGSGTLGQGTNDGASLGGDSPSGDRLIGAMDQIRVWTMARTPAQICDAALRTSCP